jgi:hypothetical protein
MASRALGLRMRLLLLPLLLDIVVSPFFIFVSVFGCCYFGWNIRHYLCPNASGYAKIRFPHFCNFGRGEAAAVGRRKKPYGLRLTKWVMGNFFQFLFFQFKLLGLVSCAASYAGVGLVLYPVALILCFIKMRQEETKRPG